jgi:2-keto-4-pentenoate hydratase
VSEDRRIEHGMRLQLGVRTEALQGGADPVGWKVGFNLPEIQARLGIDRPVVGFLTTAGLVPDGGWWPVDEGGELVAEPEIAVEIGRDGRSIAALMPAIELTAPPDLSMDLEEILADNIFHRAVSFGPSSPPGPPGAARLSVDGEVVAEATAERTGEHLEEMVAVVADRLADAGQHLRHGDRIITGVIAPPPRVHAGQGVRLELDELGAVELSLGR